MIRAFVRGNPFYFVNRGNGSGVIGATSEEDASAHAQIGEVQRLFRDALDVIPSLETARIREIRSGLRPASVTGNPFIESFNEGRVLWVSGHYRHGVTLAPLTAQDIGERICPN
jgi:glycine oxidase